LDDSNASKLNQNYTNEAIRCGLKSETKLTLRTETYKVNKLLIFCRQT